MSVLVRLAAVAACLASALLASAAADADAKLPAMPLLPTPCYGGAPVTTGALSPSAQAIEAALARKRATERLALDVHYRGGDWPPVLSAAQQALQAAVAVFGSADVCIVPFLEDVGAAAAGASDMKTAETEYRRAIDLVGSQPDASFYRATLAENLADVLAREGQESGEAATQANADRLRAAAQSTEPFTDVYAIRQSWIGPGPLDSVFLGPTTGAEQLNDMALQYGVDNEAFRFQLYELHAQDTLRELANVPERLRDTLDHNNLAALLTFAEAQDDRHLLAKITESLKALIARMTPRASRLELDEQRRSLVGVFRAQGRLSEMNEALGEIAPASLAADKDLALEVHASRTDEELLNGNTDRARTALKQAEAQQKPLPFTDMQVLFVLERAIGDLRAHDLHGAERRLAPYVAKDPAGAEHQSRLLRLLAEIAREQGRTADALRAMQQAISVTEAATNGTYEGPLSFGASENTHELTRSIDQAVTLALAARDDPQLAMFAAQATLRVRGHQLALSAARLRELHLLPLGAETKLRALRSVRSRLALELSDLGRDPDARPNWPELDSILQKEDELQQGFATQSLGAAPRPAEPDMAAILANTGDRSAMVIYVAYRPFDAIRDAVDFGTASELRMAAVLLEQGKPARWGDIGTVGTVDKAVADLRGAIVRPPGSPHTLDGRMPALAADTLEIDRAERAASALLFGPWRTELAGMRRIVIAPDGSLNLVPFAALVPVTAGVEGPTIRMIGTADDLVDRAPTPSGPAAIFANPDFAASSVTALPDIHGLPASTPHRLGDIFLELPGTSNELDGIREVLPDARVFTGAAANKAALIGLHGPAILHIATHGAFRPPVSSAPTTAQLLAAIANPMLTSALVFAGANNPNIGENALATAFELSSLDLDGTQLVVLSACDTGLGGVSVGEGVFGLRRAFAAAGARRLVLSLWEVDDPATAFLMQAFYRALKKGLEVDVALAHAQEETRRQPGWAQPYYWAGFILSGARGRLVVTPEPAALTLEPEESRSNRSLKGDVLWTYRTDGGIAGSPAVDGQLVFVGSTNGVLYALDRTAGTLKWRFATSSKIYGQAQIAGERVFFGDHDGTVYALDEASGREIWRTKVAGLVDASVAVDRGVVYVPADRLSAIDSSSGKILWSYDPAAGQPPASVVTMRFPKFNARPSLDQDFVYLGDMAGRLYKLGRSDGKPVWITSLDAGMVSQPILEVGQVIVGTWGGSVAAVDRQTGAKSWAYKSENEIDGQIVSVENLIVFGSHGFLPLTALDARTGAPAWRISMQTSGIWSLAVTGQQLLIGSLNGFWLVDLARGETRRILDAKVTSTPIAHDGIAYIGDDDGTLHAIR